MKNFFNCCGQAKKILKIEVLTSQNCQQWKIKYNASRFASDKYLLLSCRKYNKEFVVFRMSCETCIHQPIDIGNIFNDENYAPLSNYFVSKDNSEQKMQSLRQAFIKTIQLDSLQSLDKNVDLFKEYRDSKNVGFSIFFTKKTKWW